MSPSIAILCSGQGTQHAGMFDLVAQAYEAQPILKIAGEMLGREPQQFVREADATTLFSNRVGQILCCTQALAAWAIIRPHLPGTVVLAGYSVGELAAWGCAGLLAPKDVLQLAATCAEMMDEAGGTDTGLVATIGLNQAQVEGLCRSHNADLAIVNGEDFVVVGGKKEALEIIADEANAVGATSVTILRVAVASHTSLLTEASRRLDAVLACLDLPKFPSPEVRLLSGVDGEVVFDVREGSHKLAAQISQTLRWSTCLDGCHAAGAETVLELGPGHALAGMARQMFPDAPVRSVDDFRTPAVLVRWLQRV